MRHYRHGRKFGRTRNQRRALLRSMAGAFFVHGKIRTTEAKAKELRPWVERWITRARTPTLADQRILRRFFPAESVFRKLLERGAAMKGRSGGYTRITRIGVRGRDAARLAILELVR